MLEIFKAMADENRLRIINILMNYELCVCELEVILNMTQSNVSRHLAKLKNGGIISSTKYAQWIHYKLDEDFYSENDPLVKYLKLNFTNHKLFIKDMQRCKSFITSPYNCQTITNDKKLVMTYLEEDTKV